MIIRTWYLVRFSIVFLWEHKIKKPCHQSCELDCESDSNSFPTQT